ncbi:MAG TPA: hypothetical protein VKC56_13575 [Gallionellaceae bacterium]|nr:hypothetical protein [Gallionellaceae bacterium]
MMKKVALSLAGLLAAAAFAPEASALPVFARQVGMACNACHFQHYPLLNAFGRSFKASGFTLMGAEAKVEGDNLSIPAVVNAAVLTSMGYEKTNATRAPGPLNTSAGGSPTGGFYVAGYGGEASLFLGGRGSDFMGFLTEVTMGDGAAAVDSFKTPILADVGGGFRAGIVPFTTNGQGASYGFETLNTGANAVHSITNTVGFMNQYIAAVSAQQYINTAQAATGASVVAVGDMGFINITKFAQAGPAGNAAGMGWTGLTSTYARLAWTGDLGGWDSGLGIQNWSGQSLNNDPALVATPTQFQTKATAIDGQMQGAIGSLPVGFYFSYAKAPVSTTAGLQNEFNMGTKDRSSFNIDAEVGVIPEKATIGAAIRAGKSGVADAAGSNTTDNAVFLTATYKLAQNLLARLSYVTQSGSFWDQPSGLGGTNATDFGKSSYTLNLYALY